MMLLTVVWKEPEVEVLINGKHLNSLEADSTTHVVETKDPIISGTSAVDRSDAVAECKAWIAWRKQFFSVSRAPDSSRRSLSDEEQVAALESEVKALRDLAGQVSGGKRYLLPKVAGALRGLLYWKMRANNTLQPSYNPLLLRIAARAEVPLPVFAFPDDRGSRPQVVDEAQFHFINNVPTHYQLFPAQKLLDLQEWLNTPISTERFTSVIVAPATVMTVKDVIEATANTLGGAHFDEDVPKSLDTLLQLKLEDVDFLTRFLLAISDTVVALGDYAARKWREKS
jgi:hypothetical protein